MKNIFQISVVMLLLATKTIFCQATGDLLLFTAKVSNEKTIQLNRETKNENISSEYNVERKTMETNWKTIGTVKPLVLGNSLNDQSTEINYILPSDFLYGQTSHDKASVALSNDINADTASYKRDNNFYNDIHDYSKPYDLKAFDQENNRVSDIFTNYGDNILAMVAGYFQGKGEAYRVSIEYGGPLTKVYTQGELSNRWHSYSVYKSSFEIGTAFTIFLSGRNDFWRGVIQSATCLSLNNLIADGVYNNAKGFNWWRQSNDTGWELEKTLTPGVKLGILSALVAVRIVYELWLKSE